jgi:hypothetical protein
MGIETVGNLGGISDRLISVFNIKTTQLLLLAIPTKSVDGGDGAW